MKKSVIMKVLFLILSWVTLLACQHPVAANATSSISANDSTPTYSLEEDMAQMLLVGFRGTTLSSSNHIVRDIRDYKIGGVILFEYDAPSGRHERNIHGTKQLQTLCKALQELREEPLFIGIDQEGGKVCRLKSKAGFPSIISAQRMGEGGEDSVRFYALRTATMLKSMGINLNFAPCVDVNVNPDCPIIGKLERSFSGDETEVARYAKLWIQVCDSIGVMSCPKHFPGHGSSRGDSHLGLVDVSRWWQSKELYPYQQLIADSAVRMIMTTHVINRQLDPSGLPATLSKKVLTSWLRDSLHYQGLIITDDMGMGAIANEYGYKEALEMSINAGADILCIGNNSVVYNPDIVPQTIALLQELVAEGKISPARIRASATRIRHAKQTLVAEKM